MKNWLVLLALGGAGCWSSGPKERTTADPTATELATARGEVGVLERKNAELVSQLADAQERARVLEVKVKALESAAATAAVAAPPPPPPRARREPDRAKTYAISIANAPSEGPADAKITMVVAGEYGCPFCEKARSTLVELRKKYGKDLRLVFRQFIVHPQTATAAAYAACAANRQHKFDHMDMLLWEKGLKARQFDQPVTLPDGTTEPCWKAVDGCPIVLGFAKEAGLNLPRFKADMQACEAEVSDGQRELASFGVGATPSFFINGRYTSGAQPIEMFSVLIDEEAAKADERIKKGSKRAKYYQQWVLDVGDKSLATP
ncbi:MAG: oxidoreductase [Deltaproteobacteria bacterium]|nr:oxidoreductase [Deltaproteobacteria bacterium]